MQHKLRQPCASAATPKDLASVLFATPASTTCNNIRPPRPGQQHSTTQWMHLKSDWTDVETSRVQHRWQLRHKLANIHNDPLRCSPPLESLGASGAARECIACEARPGKQLRSCQLRRGLRDDGHVATLHAYCDTADTQERAHAWSKPASGILAVKAVSIVHPATVKVPACDTHNTHVVTSTAAVHSVPK
jgi:hypothetical protein